MKASSQILDSPKLKSILGIILSVGNFLNSGTSRGRARVLKPQSLLKMEEVRTTVGNSNLLAYVAGYIHANLPELVGFSAEISAVEEAMRYQPDIQREEIAQLSKGLVEVEAQLNVTQEERTGAGGLFIQYYDALSEFSANARADLESVSAKWAQFQEDSNKVLTTFNQKSDTPVEAVWGCFFQFSKKFVQTLHDIQKQKEEAENLAKIQEKENAAGNPLAAPGTAPATAAPTFTPLADQDEEKAGLMDKLIALIREGQYQLV